MLKVRMMNNRIKLSPRPAETDEERLRLEVNKERNPKYAKSKATIEELTVLPGMQKTVQLRYAPVRQIEDESKACKLTRRKFTVFLSAEDTEGRVVDKKKISGQSKVCTSFIYLPKTEFNLGDCVIGTKHVRTSHFNC